MSRIFHRSTRQAYPVAVRGEGAYLFDAAGRRYLDASGGAAVSCLGHGDEEVAAAVAAQLGRLAYAHTSFFSCEPAEELADLLVGAAPAPLGRAMFVSSGSEAVEAAIKLAASSTSERGEPGRARLIARRQSYAGNTLGALAVGGNLARRRLYGPLLAEVELIAPCYPLPRAPVRRGRGGLRPAGRRRAGGGDRAGRPRHRDRLYRGDGGWRHPRLRAPGARLSAASA